MKLELLYFDDCPSWRKALETLERVLEALKLEASIELVRVETQDEALRHRFVGSPTIRLDGEDLFPTGQTEYALGCRVYPSPEGLRGWPNDRTLQTKLTLLVPAQIDQRRPGRSRNRFRKDDETNRS